MKEHAYRNYNYRLPELKHHYGKNVHLLADPVMLTQLARLTQAETLQPEVNWLIRDIYESFVRIVIANEFPLKEREVRTRMFSATKAGVWNGALLDPDTRVVTVGMARAGTQPSQVAFEALTRLLTPDSVRQDHLYMARVTDKDGHVTGASTTGSKIGGDVDKAIVLFPDPMGATGSSMSQAVDTYKQLPDGTPKRIVALNLIVTPEYIRKVHADHPDVIIYGIRLDRGLSPQTILENELGAHPEEERGLNSKDYIIPGAGGLGEVLNNSYV